MTLVFSRSTYLQGLLLMHIDAAAAKVPHARAYKQQLQEMADQAGLPLAELALRYVLSQDALTSSLIGLDSAAQLRENLVLLEKGPLDPELVRHLERVFQSVPDEVVNPSLWNLS